METNQFDKNIEEKFKNRTFEPSDSAWERLVVQLDEKEKKKRSWFVYVGYAASIMLLVSIGFQFFSKEKKLAIPKNEVVIQPIDTNLFDIKSKKIIEDTPVENAIVKILEKEATKQPSISIKKGNKKIKKKVVDDKNTILVASVDTTSQNKIQQIGKNNQPEKVITILKQNPNNSIKINSDDLLYSVTHTKEEVKNYYAKYNINRSEVLKSIEEQLQKSNLSINPNTILAEVERDINEDDFENNFMKSLKKKVTNIATAIASRND